MSPLGRPATWSAILVLAAGTALAAAPGGSAASSAGAAELVHWMRSAPATVWFTGEVRLDWRDGSARRALTVSVTGDHGAMEVRAGDATILEHGHTTYVKGLEGRPGWSAALVWPEREPVPDPDHHLVLRERDGRPVAGRPTRMVEGARRSGAPAVRLYVDEDTGLLLRRDVLDRQGRVARSFAFVEVTVENGAELRAPADVRARRAKRLDVVPPGFFVPDDAAGFVLVGGIRNDDGIELLYHDGVFAVTVAQERGSLDWGALPPGGDATEVDGRRARRYVQPGVDVLVWERDGTVFTLVADAPRDVAEALAAAFAPRRSAAERVVTFVLGPFGWG